ncbi:ferric reductase family protein LALA0_S13e00122g [Lachancea lanzarotensis]|uniref:LALA0S13e00122g1_1 n=1 Tax=Lachancea lanzarotensis TaxID=1245769 RepID=A0A0C7NG41_9SACH|nr:uncharacterized protein LALA0_S13e00122g [Lachancea lanzarotensis]CEP64662.1 LALA0S13e00122g1_1 [Lachancea lanzarotensis]
MSSTWRAIGLAFHTNPISQSLQALLACISETSRLDWAHEEDPEASFYATACGSYMPFMQTAMHCYVSLTENESTSLVDRLNTYRSNCNGVAGTNFSESQIWDIWSNGTQFLRDSHNVGEKVHSAPVLLSQDDIFATYNYYHYTFYNLSAAFNFNLVINGSVVVLVLFAIWARYTSCNTRFVRAVRSKLLVPAIFGTTHHTESRPFPFYKVLLPTRGDAVALAVFLSINAVIALYNFPVVSSNMDTKFYFLVRCVANRCGGLAFGLVPLTILLAGRNNPLLNLTGVPYSSFIFFHKWAARTMTLYAFTHSMLWTMFVVVRERMSFWYFFFNYEYWRWGTWATVAATALIFHSIHSIKAKQYEIFLTVHIIMALVFIAGCLKHCATFGWLGWIYLAVAFWAWDRAIRLWRLFFNFGGYRNAYARCISVQEELFQITVPHVESARFQFFPGCYGFLYFLGRSSFWQSHPFTLMKSKDNLEVIVKAKGGITRELYETLPQDGTKVPLRVAIEGPYGHEASLSSYDNALLIASGAGLPGPLSYLNKATDQMDETGNYTFVWIVPTEAFLATMQNEFSRISEKVRLQGAKRNIKIHVYVTRPQLNEEYADWWPQEIQVHKYKPDVEEIVSSFCKAATGTIGVVSCANPGLDDKIRHYVAGHILHHGSRIDYFDELQVW